MELRSDAIGYEAVSDRVRSVRSRRSDILDAVECAMVAEHCATNVPRDDTGDRQASSRANLIPRYDGLDA
jgi:hypothetical protein